MNTEPPTATAGATDTHPPMDVVDLFGLGFWWWSASTRRLHAQPSMRRITGDGDGVDARAAAWLERIPPDDRRNVRTALCDHLQGRTPMFALKHRLRHAGGGTIWVYTELRVVERRAGGRPQRIAGRLTDVSAAHAVEARRLADLALESARRARVEFLHNLGRDMRTPLNAVIGFSQLLLNATAEPQAQQVREYARHMLRAGEQLLALIDREAEVAASSGAAALRRGTPGSVCEAPTATDGTQGAAAPAPAVAAAAPTGPAPSARAASPAAAVSPPAPPRAPPPAPPRAPTGALKLLYVEDNRINAILFVEALGMRDGIDLRIAEDADDAMEQIAGWTPDVLVLDANLPGMNGFDLLATLRSRPELAGVPAFMCSADAMPDDIQRAASSGFVGYWPKPINISRIMADLDRLIEAMGGGRP